MAFWVAVTKNPDTSATGPCVTFVDNTDGVVTTKLVNQRVAGSTDSRVRSISMTQANPAFTSTAKTLDAADRNHPLGASDYSMADHRFYVTESNGDGGLINGRIMNNLIVDGVVEIAQF